MSICYIKEISILLYQQSCASWSGEKRERNEARQDKWDEYTDKTNIKTRIITECNWGSLILLLKQVLFGRFTHLYLGYNFFISQVEDIWIPVEMRVKIKGLSNSYTKGLFDMPNRYISSIPAFNLRNELGWLVILTCLPIWHQSVFGYRSQSVSICSYTNAWFVVEPGRDIVWKNGENIFAWDARRFVEWIKNSDS